MKKAAIATCLLALAPLAGAEWFEVKSVTSYNQLVAARPNAPANTINIRIRNLENIEDIQMDRTKVLLSGLSTQQLAKDALMGQLVWIENLQEESGTYVGSVYLSYEQMVRGYAKQRLVGGQTLTPELKAIIQEIYRRMVRSFETATIPEDSIASADNAPKTAFKKAYERATGTASKQKNDKSAAYPTDYFTYDTYYTDDYLKAIFAYEALSWYKEEGQFLPINIQKMFVTWLSQYQTATDQRAKDLEKKILDLTVRYELYKDFAFED